MNMESLEQRFLMSITLKNHVLTLIGTDGMDGIGVTPLNDNNVLVNVGLESQQIKQSKIEKIVIKGLGGLDNITVPWLEFKGVVIARGGPDIDNIALSTPGDDTLIGGSGGDIMYGGKGDDLLKGQSGFDNLFGQQGNDTLIGGTGGDQFQAGPGRDLLKSADGEAEAGINGDTGHDTLIADLGEDVTGDTDDILDQFKSDHLVEKIELK